MGGWRLGLVALVAALPGLAAGQDAPPQLGEVPELIAQLKASYDSRSSNAAHRLARLGAPAVPALVEVLRDRTLGSLDGVRQPARSQAALALKHIGPPAREAVTTLLAIVRDASEDEGVRAASASALGSIGERPDEVVPVLVGLLGGPPSSLSFYALGGLADLAKAGGTARQAVARALPALYFADSRFDGIAGFEGTLAILYRAVEAPSPERLALEDELRAVALRDRLLSHDGAWCLRDTIPDAVLVRLADLGVSRERDDCRRGTARLDPRGFPWLWSIDVGAVVWRTNDRAVVTTSACCCGAIPCSVDGQVVARGLGGWRVVERFHSPGI